MAEDFVKGVEDGLKLSKRLYYGKDRAVAFPTPPIPMDKTSTFYLPTSPMLYAVINDPEIVDNPDIASYQPHVHGRCDPPALIPLHMNSIQLEVDCFLDTAIIKVSGSWRLHCVMNCRTCDCRIAIPMGHQGSILGVEASVPAKSFSTQLVDTEDNKHKENATRVDEGGFLKPNIFTMNLPAIVGGSQISIKMSWSQKMLYSNGEFSLNVPFTFPDFVNPPWKHMIKREKIQLHVNAGAGSELLCKGISHPLKEVSRQAGSVCLLYESDVLSWTKNDFTFSYAGYSSDINGLALWESASEYDSDQREMFCIYLSPGNLESRKVFKKDIIFVVDISGSMRGKLIDDIKHALSAALSKLSLDDSFSIIAFNGETYLFSTSMTLASKDAVEKAIEWINMNFVAGDGTNILQPLNKAIEMLSSARSSVPIIFLVTDGTVEDERQICDMIKKNIISGSSICPRIYTFGIGLFCNHYFLKMLALIGRGQYDAAMDLNLVESQMLDLYDKASSIILANITIDTLGDLDEVEVYPSSIPDLSTQGPLMLSGRYKGKFPETLKAKGVLADFSNFVIDMKIEKAKDIPLLKVSAKEQIEKLTAQAWLSENKQLEQKVAKLSLQTGFMSEYTCMILVESENPIKVKVSARAKEVSKKKQAKKKADVQAQAQVLARRIFLLPKLGIRFGNLSATVENTIPGSEEARLPEAAELFVKSAANCCGRLCHCCCSMCCIKTCSRINNQCATLLSQICVSLGCYGCLTCCSEICCCCSSDT